MQGFAANPRFGDIATDHSLHSDYSFIFLPLVGVRSQHRIRIPNSSRNPDVPGTETRIWQSGIYHECIVA